ncbi:hypothetical protein C8Q80DRAFT_1124085 [Daedaleopsis nitida]|nr:hypothetical protein C8Q80DRAFT_1124085 [Daedaleopsis nitida]
MSEKAKIHPLDAEYVREWQNETEKSHLDVKDVGRFAKDQPHDKKLPDMTDNRQPPTAWDVGETTTVTCHCRHCENPNHAEYHPSETVIDRGDFVSVYESIHEVVYRATGYTPTDKPPDLTLEQLGKRYKLRPAISLESFPVAATPTDRVHAFFLSATLGAKFLTYADLPRIFQWFAIPIYPHPVIGTPNDSKYHLHTTPEWDESFAKPPTPERPYCAWLILATHEISAKSGKIGKRWPNSKQRDPDSPSSSSFKVDSLPLDEIRALAEQLWKSWGDLCASDPAKSKEYLDDYRIRVGFTYQIVQKVMDIRPEKPQAQKGRGPRSRGQGARNDHEVCPLRASQATVFVSLGDSILTQSTQHCQTPISSPVAAQAPQNLDNNPSPTFRTAPSRTNVNARPGSQLSAERLPALATQSPLRQANPPAVASSSSSTPNTTGVVDAKSKKSKKYRKKKSQA